MECLFEHQWHENEQNKLKIAGLVVFCTKDSLAVFNVTNVAECACKVSLHAPLNINTDVFGKKEIHENKAFAALACRMHLIFRCLLGGRIYSQRFRQNPAVLASYFEKWSLF